MTKILLLMNLFLISTNTVLSQCATADDNLIKEASIRTATHNLIEGSTRFGLELLRALNNNQTGNEDSGGLFFSPHIIWSALMVTYMGAQGATEQEMKHVLGIGDTDKVTTWEAFRNITNFGGYKQTQSKAASYNSANRIYFQGGTQFKKCLLEMLNNDIAFLDFETNAAEAREAINTWVENQTHQKIKDLIPRDGIDALTNMVIANAVYFKEAWLEKFSHPRTVCSLFTNPSGHLILVNMMTTTGHFWYGESEELQCRAVVMPYTGKRSSMTILLPNNRSNGVDVLTQNLTPDRLTNLLTEMRRHRVIVSIPKFKMENSFELSSVLPKVGLRTLFDAGRVDLSGFTGSKEFTVGAVHHKSFIDVNEEGTEDISIKFGFMSQRQFVHFSADHAFIYFIRDHLSNAILFLGTVRTPTEVPWK